MTNSVNMDGETTRFSPSPIYASAFVIAAVGFVIWAVAAWQMPLDSYLRDTNFDDSFYYFVIARNFAHGAWSTFDGWNLTNGYHPIWAALLAPVFGLIADPSAALRAAKLLELLCLVGATGLLLVAGRAAGWNWLAAWVVPLWLFGHTTFFRGLETAPQVLLLALALTLTVRLFVDLDRLSSWVWLAILCAVLPWVRLELVAAATVLAACVTAYSAFLGRWHGRNVILLWALIAAGFLGYLAYNKLVFGTPWPVSGQVKNYWSSLRIAKSEHFSWLDNAVAILRPHIKETFVALVSLALVIGSWLVPTYRWKGRYVNHAFDAFLVTLACAHLSRLGYSMLVSHVDYDAGWYYVPGQVAVAVIVPVVLARVGLLSHPWRKVDARWIDNGFALACAAGAVVAFQTPWTPRGHIDWNAASYEGVQWMNKHLPPGARVGVPDAGVVGYFSTNHQITNLDGLVNSDAFFAAIRSQGVEHWLHDNGIAYLAGGIPQGVDGCAYMAQASGQAQPYGGPCRKLYEGAPFGSYFAGERLDMRFTVFAFGDKTGS
jgi:hypothetical protein